MVLTVYDEERHIRNEKAISREEGQIIMLLELVCNLLRSHSDLSILTSTLGFDEVTVSGLQQIAAPFAPDYNIDDVIAAWEDSR